MMRALPRVLRKGGNKALPDCITGEGFSLRKPAPTAAIPQPMILRRSKRGASYQTPLWGVSSLDLGRASEVRPLFLTLAASALISQQLRASAQEGDTLKHPKTARQYHRGEQGNKKPLVRQLKSRAVTPVTGEAAGTTTLLRDCGKASTILSR